MGAPMVRRLVDAGHQVRALGRTDEKCAALRDLGAEAVTDMRAVGEDAEVVVVCVFTDDQVQQVCLHSELLSAMAPGSVLVVHTTASPRTVETIAAKSGVDVLDAPVSGGPHDIAAGQVTLFVGGSDDAVAMALPALTSYADPVLHVGALGAGARVKLVNNALFAAQLGLLREAARLGDRLGVEEPKLLSALSHGSAASRVGGFVAARGSVAGFVDGVAEFIGKDVAVVRSIAAELDSDLGLLDDNIDAALGPNR